jgi:hypothetical protein
MGAFSLLQKTQNWPPLPRDKSLLTVCVRGAFQLWILTIVVGVLYLLAEFLFSKTDLPFLLMGTKWLTALSLRVTFISLYLSAILSVVALIKVLMAIFVWEFSVFRDAVLIFIMAVTPIIGTGLILMMAGFRGV